MARKLKSRSRKDQSMQDAMTAFVGALDKKVKDRIDRKKPVEARVLTDLRQFHGLYEPDVARKLKDMERSQIHINMTRPRTTALAARLGDLLFPTDERNWAIKPTPVPEMAGGADSSQELALEARATRDEFAASAEQEIEAGNADAAEPLVAKAEEAQAVMDEADKAADELQGQVEKAKKAADLMQQEITDQLVECDYPIEGRRIIMDACKTGIGILKGPVRSYKPAMRWRPGGDESAPEVFSLVSTDDDAPSAYRVSFWNYFPDPDVRDPSDGEGVFERHLYNRKQMRAMSRESGIDRAAIRELLESEPSAENPDYLVDLHSMNSGSSESATTSPEPRYHVWEYSGPITADELELLGEWFEKDIKAFMIDGEIDPLAEIMVRLWFCQDKVLRFGLYHLDSNETIYSTFLLEPDEEGPWGFGVPYLMRDPAKVLNSATRMMMDNGGVAIGPQIVIDSKRIQPMDGVHNLYGMKLWEFINDASSTSNVDPFQTFDINSAQAESGNIIEMAARMIDDVTSMPPIAMGEEGAGVNQTAQGMAIQMNSANVVFRRWVKHYDDGITKPMIRRFYHWNMQFSDKDAIKGDYEVDARGSTVLLVREMQAQNLVMMAERFGGHPEFGPMHDKRGLLQEIYRAHQVPTDNVLLSNTQWQEEKAKMAEQPDPAVVVAQMEAKDREADRELKREEMEWKERIANTEAESRKYVADRGFEEAKLRDAQRNDADLMKEVVRSRDRQATVEQKDRSLAVEVAEKHRTGEGAGGAI